MSARVTVLLLALLAPAPGWAEEPLPSLRHNPFDGPDPSRLAAGAGVARRDAQDWAPVLRGTLLAGPDSVANLGGDLLAVGQESHGYRLLEVREREAVFELEGARVVLSLDPPRGED